MLSDYTTSPPPFYSPTPSLILFISWIFSSRLSIPLSNSSSVLIIGDFSIYIFDPISCSLSFFIFLASDELISHPTSPVTPIASPQILHLSPLPGPRAGYPNVSHLAYWSLWIQVTSKSRTLWPLSVPLKAGDKSAVRKVPRPLHLEAEKNTLSTRVKESELKNST